MLDRAHPEYRVRDDARKRHGKDMPDHHIWTIVCAPSSVSSATLAATLGIPLVIVTRVRLKLRREGWTCRVDYVPCTVCGELMTNNVAVTGSCTHHADCRPTPGEAIRAIQTDRQRYLVKGPRRASENGGRTAMLWSEDEDAIVIAHAMSETTASIAHLLGRTEASVRSRRTKLRLDGRLD